ncbi:hypothetical protein ACM26V_12145 [Salipaludibacillus sp. HK11]|uniref:hypothetical protein n=1 Tax=Salipaludibacillus sp. HK11 TaxID=3394320 RepID=UPI0039FD7268
MLHKLKEEDFLVLRGPFESKRQSPNALGAAFILAIFGQALFLFLESFIGGYSMYPFKDEIFKVHLVLSCVLGGLSLIYSIPAVFSRSQKMQYFINTLVSQNLFGVSAYLVALIAIGTEISDEAVLLQFTAITLIIGGIVFLITIVRFGMLLKKGEYKKGSKKDKLRNKFETSSYIPLVIIVGIGVSFIIQFLIRNFNTGSYDLIFIITLAVGLFWTMLFVLPEQLVLQYCKSRFDSFNYEQNGELKPVKGDDVNSMTDSELKFRN